MRLPFAAVAALVLSLAGQARAMTFEPVSGPAPCAARACILARGEIDAKSPAALRDYLRSHVTPKGGLLILDSEGGDLLPSLQLGNEIRAAGLDTAVGAYDAQENRLTGGACASACAYSFLGGVQRSVEPGSRIGVHQIFTRGDTWALSAQDGLQLMSMIASHVERLGGRLELLIPAMRTPPESMHWLSSSELSRYEVVTVAAVKG